MSVQTACHEGYHSFLEFDHEFNRKALYAYGAVGSFILTTCVIDTVFFASDENDYRDLFLALVPIEYFGRVFICWTQAKADEQSLKKKVDFKLLTLASCLHAIDLYKNYQTGVLFSSIPGKIRQIQTAVSTLEITANTTAMIVAGLKKWIS